MTGHPYLIDVAGQEPRPFYDANATRIELWHRDVDDPSEYGKKMRIAALYSYTPGVDEVVVELAEDEARALAAALAAGFVRADPVDEV